MEIVEYLGMGREGAVFIVKEDGTKKVAKFFRFPINNKKDVIDKLNEAEIRNFFYLDFKDSHILQYDYIKLFPLENNIENFVKVLKIIGKLYTKTKLGYYDLDLTRGNFLKNKYGEIYCVDYINGFVKIKGLEVLAYKLNIINAIFYVINRSVSLNQRWINRSRTSKVICLVTLGRLLFNMIKYKIPLKMIFYDLEKFMQYIIVLIKRLDEPTIA